MNRNSFHEYADIERILVSKEYKKERKREREEGEGRYNQKKIERNIEIKSRLKSSESVTRNKINGGQQLGHIWQNDNSKLQNKTFEGKAIDILTTNKKY